MARKDRKDRGLFTYRAADGATLYGVRLWSHGRAHKWQGFLRIQQARNWYEDRKRDLREGRPFPARRVVVGDTLADVIRQYLEQNTNKKDYAGEQAFGRYWTARLGTESLASLTPDRIDKERTRLLKAGLKGRPLTHARVNRYIAWLHHVCQLEVRKGTLPLNPCRHLKFKERQAPEVEYSPDEEAALMRELGDQACYPVFAILTGLRQGEQFRLRWEDLDLDRGYGKLHDPKGGEPQIFLINAAAKAILEDLKVTAGASPWVFPNPKAPLIPRSGKAWYKNQFKPAAKRAGIILSRTDGKTYHTLRHTFASRLQQKGVEVKDIKDLGRWKSWKAMDRYLKRDQARLRGAIERLGTAPNLSVEKKSLQSVKNYSPNILRNINDIE